MNPDEDYVIAIPSYKRVKTLTEKTLATLKRYKVDKKKIYVFVANKEEEALYKEGVGDSVGHIIVGELGLANARNFIMNYFKKGVHIVCMDDDIKQIIEYDSNTKRHEKELESLAKVIKRGYSECEKTGARLWGVYPSPNGYFMKPTVTTDLKFIVGSFWGCINPGNNDALQLKLGGEKEDYQRTLQFWEEDGAVVRLNFVSVKTAYYKEPGGMQHDGKRLAAQRKTVKDMLKKWPQYVKLNPKRKSGFPEIRIRATRKL